MRLLSKLKRLASNMVYYFSKNLIKAYNVYTPIYLNSSSELP